MPLGGGTVTSLADGDLDYDSLAADGDTVFFGLLDQTLMQIPVTGGMATRVAAGVGGVRALDANNLYTISPVASAAFAVSRANGTSVALGPILQTTGALASDGTFVYLADFLYQNVAPTDAKGVLYRVPVGGGQATTLASMPGFMPVGVTIRGGFAYVGTIGGQSAVMRIPLTGGDAVPFAWSANGSNLVTDDKYLYFFDVESNGVRCLKRKALAGGDVSILASATDLPDGLAVDADYAYLAGYQSVMRVHH